MGISTLLNILITYKLVHRELIDRPYKISFVTFKFMNAYEIMSKIKNFLDLLNIKYEVNKTTINIINGGSINFGMAKLKNADFVYIDDCSYMKINIIEDEYPYLVLCTTGAGKYINDILDLRDNSTFSFNYVSYEKNKYHDENWANELRNAIGDDMFNNEYDIDKVIKKYEANKSKNS
jgi:hypothetical protein